MELDVTTTLSHDLAGHRTQITRSGGRSWKYTYDRNGNVIAEQVPGSSSPITDLQYTTTIAYDDLDRPTSLLDLLRALNDLRVDVTFRLSSLEPMDCSPAIVDLIASSGGRFAPHFHLPLQHASNRMLAAMKRPYTLAYYRGLVDSIVARMPHASIGSDMIVGFPGETADDFDENLAYLPGSPLTHLHVFPYSDREGTSASRMDGKVDGPTIRSRGAQLRALGSTLTRRFHDRQRGTVRPGLTLEDGTLVVTDNYLKVRIPAGVNRNERVQVRLLSATEGVRVAGF